jgi:predicted acylesterase/phospholipase RssA
VRALREEGIPIDSIGTCSMGSQVGGLVARELSLEEICTRKMPARFLPSFSTTNLDTILTYAHFDREIPGYYISLFKYFVGYDNNRRLTKVRNLFFLKSFFYFF